jgi:circadian clock protein KaiC
VTTFLLVNLPGALALDVEGGPDVSYLADTVILYRNYEYQGEVHHALSVLKHRGAAVERTLRELTLTSDGLAIGEALSGFSGVLTGTPRLNDPHGRR